ncbi:hypothetical protein HLRTI_002493 [Halorhabdus tiamatea SARL4B]|uniref:Uncharacterized protein n=1 Tax=Halorhabdus tiamatea SARL4B TaxID=1033806 RepID=U2F5J1_9EURY|nr:hypothetical protein [Halorhabdus tiamatea]ERJ05515.1 hypothetical protein HLRTI_002493 [Halorhabdus tiamatea SARL4B]
MGFDNVDGTEEDCDICLSFYLWRLIDGSYQINMEWTYDGDAWFDSNGYEPEDVAGIYYNPNKWDFYSNSLSETTSTTGNVTAEDDDLSHGVGFSVNDHQPGNDYCSASVRVEPVGDYDPDERWVRGEYIHTWNDSDVDYSIGVGPSGISIVYDGETETKKEMTSTEGDGDTIMKLTEGDVDDGYGR